MRGGAVSSILKGKSWRFNCYNSGFFNVNAKENEKKRRKKDQQLSSRIKVYTEKSLNVGFEFMLIMIALLFHAKLCFNVSWKTKSTRSVLLILRNLFSRKWFLLNREFDQTFRTILQPSFNGLIAAASGPLVCWRPSLLLMLIYNVKRMHVVVLLIHDITLHYITSAHHWSGRFNGSHRFNFTIVSVKSTPI